MGKGEMDEAHTEASGLCCPTCGSRALEPDEKGTLTCARCGSVCEVTGRICPECGSANAPGTERCAQCGHALDLVGFVLRTRLLGSADRLQRIRRQAEAFRQEAEAASQERLGLWWAQEEERRRALARAQAERDRQERMVLAGALIFAAAVLIGLLVHLLVTGSAGPGAPVVTPTALP